MADPSFDVDVAHRWFAIETNNATWDWLEANKSGDTTDPVIHMVHASYHHWSQVGTTINKARAALMVANVHATVGNASLAEAFARQCLTLIEEAGSDAEDWDLAFAHDSLARAFAAAGDARAAEQRQIARSHGDLIANPGDKKFFDDWWG